MRITHLNCGTMCPPGRRWVNGTGSLWSRGRMVCHCLLIELPSGLCLVETGLGTADVARPRERLGFPLVPIAAPKLDPQETALAQIAALGFKRDDVRHIVLTHADLDHAGGISDFPNAQVHLSAMELDALSHPRLRREREGYRPAQWAHGPRWVAHELRGERWFDFDAVRPLPDAGDEVLLIPLFGHSRGHLGVAVRDGDRFLLHAGDAYFHHDQMDPVRPHAPIGLWFFQRFADADRRTRLQNQERLRELSRAQRDLVTVFCAHDASELDAAQSAGHVRTDSSAA